jgi:metallo-beta-lactamase family protein
MSSQPTITFLGAAGTVTGSRYLLSSKDHTILVDCGLFQGYKNLRQRNWQPFAREPKTIDAVLLTHAHLDHSGYLPRLVASGFKGPIYCTGATRDLCEILLMDSAKLQEEEAAYNNRHRYSRHDPALPLYTIKDAEHALSHFETIPYSYREDDAPTVSIGDISARFFSNGHILGSSFIDVTIGGKHVLFSGDMGRPNDLLMNPPVPPVYCDYLVIESTYGDRLHGNQDIWEAVADIVNRTAARGGSLLIPSFAVGRAQLMLYLLTELRRRELIPPLPIYLDSPMAISATEILKQHPQLHRLDENACEGLSRDVHFTRTVEESMAINEVTLPCVVLSASGMATGGRVLHHLSRMLGDHRNTVLFAGYQAPGTRGARLVNGEKKIKIFGRYHDVRAEVCSLGFLSAHADWLEMVRWLQQLPVAPKHCFVTHGEPAASDQFRVLLNEEMNWSAGVPNQGDIEYL